MKQDQKQPVRKRKCEFCRKKINVGTFQLHLTKCKQKILKQKQQKIQNEKQKETMKKPTQFKVQVTKIEIAMEKQIKKKEQNKQERFPCYLCGYQQSLRELDSHPNVCPNRQIRCIACNVKVPKNMMQDHKAICVSNRVATTQRIQSTSTNQSNSQPIISNQSQIAPSNRPQIPQSSNTVANVIRTRTQSQTISQTSRVAQSISQPRSNNQTDETFRNFQRRITAILSAQRQLIRIFQQRQRTEAINNQSSATQRQSNTQSSSSRNYQQQLYQFIMRQQAVDRRIEVQMQNMRQLNLTRQLANRQLSKKTQGIPPQLIKLIPQKKFIVKEQYQCECCSICCVQFSKNDVLKNLKCKHDFHSKCIGDWLKINRSCPLCKTDLSVNIPKLEKENMQKKETITNPQINAERLIRSLYEGVEQHN